MNYKYRGKSGIFLTQEGFKRKLTAILSADAVGYSRLMEEDEEATVRTLAAYVELITSIIEKQQGRKDPSDFIKRFKGDNRYDVKTSYGSTHINVSGPIDGHPLVLLHAAGWSSTAWFANIAGLSAHYRVYAVDLIGDAGKSIAECLMEKRSDYAGWLREVFDWLNIERGYLLGHSYGGRLALNMALAYPDRLRKIVLLAPAASIYPMRFMTKLGLRLSELKIRPSARSVFKMIAFKGAVFEKTFIHLMEMVTQYCLPATMFPTVYTDAELTRIDLPALLLIGAGERIYNPQKAIDRAQRLMPDPTAEIIPKAGHPLNMEQPEIINARILKFLNSN